MRSWARARTGDPWCYSDRSACIGGIDAARLPGISAATNAHSVSDPVATARATGSQNFTPYNCAASNLPAPIASGTPSPNPIATRVNALRRTRFTTAPLFAPAGGGVGGEPVRADRPEKERHTAEEPREARDRALLIERQRNLLLERPRVHERQARIDLRHPLRPHPVP